MGDQENIKAYTIFENLLQAIIVELFSNKKIK